MKKGFTLVELLAVIMVLAIIMGIAVVVVNNVVESGKKSVYVNYERDLRGATENYFINHMSEMPLIGSSKKIEYKTLLEAKETETLKDPRGGNCDASYVLATRKPDIGNNIDIDYKICLICTNYKSSGC